MSLNQFLLDLDMIVDKHDGIPYVLNQISDRVREISLKLEVKAETIREEMEAKPDGLPLLEDKVAKLKETMKMVSDLFDEFEERIHKLEENSETLQENVAKLVE